MTARAPLSRCPACNPLHGGGPTSRFISPSRKSYGRGGTRSLVTARAAKHPSCGLCRGTQRVPVAVSVRYVEALRAQEAEP